MTRRKGGGDHPGRAVLGSNVGDGKVTKQTDKMQPKKKKRLTYLERLAECDVSEELRVSISLALKKLETSEDMKELELPSSLSSEERKYVHIVSQQMGFKSKSRGGVEDRRIVLTKKEESEKPLRQRSWKRRALRYGGVEELLRQKAERRKVRELEAENERLLRLEEEKSKVLGFEESSSADCSNDRSSTSKSNVPSEVQSSYSNVDMDARSGLTRLPMRRSEAARHLHHPGAVPTSRRCSEGDASFTDTYGRSRNRSPHLLAPAPGGYHSQGGRFGPQGHGDRPPLQYSMRESPHQCRPSAASLAHPLPPTLEGMEAQGFPYTTDLRGPPVPTRDHFSPAFRPHHEQGPRAEPEPVPYHFLSRPPPPHPYPLDPLCTPPPRRRHSLHNPAFFNVPPPLANSPDFRHYSSQEDIRCSSEYSVIAPSEPKWSDYGYYTNLGDGAGPEYMPSSSGNFHSGVTPPNAPTGASVAFPPPDHAVIKTELPEVKYEPYDPAFT